MVGYLRGDPRNYRESSEVIQGRERKKELLLAEGLCGLGRNGNQFIKIKSNIGTL